MLRIPFASQSNPQVGEFAEILASELEDKAGEIVDDWMDWLRQRVGTRAVLSLPEPAVRNHIPPVVLALARFLRTPSSATTDEMLGHLRIHAQVRRDQGYDLQELLAEFDGLSHRITQHLHEKTEELPDRVDATTALEVFSRLHTGLRAISFVIVGIYEDRQSKLRKELARRLDEYGRTIAHELRSPLNSLLLETQLLARDEIATDPETRAKHLELMRGSIRRAADLLDNINTLAFIESTQAEGPLIRLDAAFAAIVEELTALASERGVRIEHGDFPAVELEATPLQVALVNLLSNAIKYCDQDKPDRWVRVDARLVSSELETAFCVVTVTDNGVGISEDMRSRIFQRHFRARPELADGTGLGLAITRQVLQERSGELEFDSTVGEGSMFRFRMRAIEIPISGGPVRDDASLLRDSIKELEECGEDDTEC